MPPEPQVVEPAAHRQHDVSESVCCPWMCVRMHAADVDDGDTFGDGRGRRPGCGDLTDSVQFRAHSGGLAGTRAVGQLLTAKSPLPAGLPFSPALPQPLFEALAYTAFPHASEISSSPSIDAHHLNLSRVVGCLF